MARNIIVTNTSTANVSTSKILTWINATLQVNYTRIQDTCTGVSYCQLMQILFPGSVAMKKVKVTSNQEHEYIQNFKTLQASFEKLKVDRDIPIEKLVKGRYQDNFEFAQWFKLFFHANEGKEGQTDDENSKTRKYSIKDVLSVSTNENRSTPSTTKCKQHVRSKYQSVLGQESVSEIMTLITELAKKIDELQMERNFYYGKLRDIEIVCQERVTCSELKPIRDILYATEEGFSIPEDDDENNNEDLFEN